MKRFALGLACLAGLAFATEVRATNLTPGGPATSIGTGTETGTLIASGTQNVTVSGTSAQLSYSVYRESGGTLDFAYQLKNTSTTGQVLSSIALQSFKQTATINAFYESGTGQSPNSAQWSSSKNTVNLFYSLADGQSSAVVVLQTTAKTYGVGQAQVTDDHQLTFAPYAPSPEPSSLALLGTCLAGLGVGAWRRRKAAQAV